MNVSATMPTNISARNTGIKKAAAIAHATPTGVTTDPPVIKSYISLTTRIKQLSLCGDQGESEKCISGDEGKKRRVFERPDDLRSLAGPERSERKQHHADHGFEQVLRDA